MVRRLAFCATATFIWSFGLSASSAQQQEENQNCGQGGEGGSLDGHKFPPSVTVGCSNGEKIAGVTFAHYGLPTGSCGGPDPTKGTGGKDTFEPGKTCDVDGTAVAFKECVGKATCTIDCGPVNSPGAGNKIFNKDPCVGTTKHCAIVVQCPTDLCVKDPSLCAYHPMDSGGWGWTFLLLVFLLGGLYAVGGVAYNHKQKGMPLNASALPHREKWIGLAALVVDGSVFTRAKFDEARAKVKAGGETPLLDDPQPPPSACPPPRKKKLEPKPDPDRSEQDQNEDGSWIAIDREMLEHRQAGVHSSMQKIKVEIALDEGVE